MPELRCGGNDGEIWSAGMCVMQRLVREGYSAYLVGGCVRDRLLGLPLHDVDIAASAKPEEVMAVFERTVPTGLRHGTVTVLCEGRPVEVTTFRTESGYADARRPDAVHFVNDIRLDLARRDFTINAMAVGLDGELVDPFGGRRDLEKRIVRCVGDASIRFGEDALRMVRAIRFAAGLRFGLALSVWREIRKQKSGLRMVAMERIGAEWDKMMAGADPERACKLLERSGLLHHLREPLPAVILHAATAPDRDDLRRLVEIAEPDLRWAAWLMAKGAGPEEGEKLCRALKFSGNRMTRITKVLAFDRRVSERPDDRGLFLTAVLDCGRKAAADWMRTRQDSSSHQTWLESLKIDHAGQLAVKGDELARRLGKPPGPWIAEMLRRLLHEAAFGRLANDKETLLQEASRYDDRTF